MHNKNHNALESLLPSHMKQKTKFEEIIRHPTEYIVSYQLILCPANSATIFVKIENIKQLHIIYSSQISSKAMEGEHVLQILNTFNNKITTSNFKYYMSKSNNSIQAKLSICPNFYDLDDFYLIKTELCEDFVKSLNSYEQLIKEIILYNPTKIAKTSQRKSKKSIQQSSILFKLKIYMEEKVKKNVSDNSDYKLTNIFKNQPKSQKSYLGDNNFCGLLQRKKEKLFLTSQSNYHINRIMRKIKMCEKMCFDEIWKPTYSHNFGQIRKFTSKYEISEGSVYQQTNVALNQVKIVKQEGTLIQKKQIIQKQQCRDSFQTEVGILLMIRDKKCDAIGEYFIEQMNGSYVDKLYSYFYPHNFTLQKIKKLKTVKKIAVFANLAKGLGFLNYNFLTHRDIKPYNIMVDRKTSPRIIDFGSAITPNIKSLKYKINYSLRTTKFYNIRYEELSNDVRKFIQKGCYQKHLNFDMYAFGKIIQETLLNETFKNQIGESFYDLFIWLSENCVELDPNLRIGPQDVAIFCRYILSQFNETLG